MISHGLRNPSQGGGPQQGGSQWVFVLTPMLCH